MHTWNENGVMKRARSQERAAEARAEAEAGEEAQSEDSGLSIAWRIFITHQRQHLAADISESSEDLCGPSVVIRRYLSLSQTCKEMRQLVLQEALPRLSENLPAGIKARLGDFGGQDFRSLFRKLLQDPTSCRVAELQEAARYLKIAKSGTKAQLAERLLAGISHWNGKTPKLVPLDLLLAVLSEKHERPRGDLHMVFSSELPGDWEPYHSGCLYFHNVFKARKHVSAVWRVSDGASWEQLLERLQERAELMAAAAASREGFIAAVHSKKRRDCVCPAAPSLYCSNRLCERCCRSFGDHGHCPFHGTGRPGGYPVV